MVLAGPEKAGWQTTAAVLGGPALYLLGNLLFKKAVFRKAPLSHAVGIVATLAFIPFATHIAPWLLSLATTVILLVIALWEKTAACPQLDIEEG